MTQNGKLYMVRWQKNCKNVKYIICQLNKRKIIKRRDPGTNSDYIIILIVCTVVLFQLIYPKLLYLTSGGSSIDWNGGWGYSGGHGPPDRGGGMGQLFVK